MHYTIEGPALTRPQNQYVTAQHLRNGHSTAAATVIECEDNDNGKQLKHRTTKNGHREIYERYYDYSVIDMESSTTAPFHVCARMLDCLIA